MIPTGLSGRDLISKRVQSFKMTCRIKRWRSRSSLRHLKNGGGVSETSVVQPKLDDPILLIYPEHVDNILIGSKTIETRSVHTRKKRGSVIFISSTGTGEIQGYVYLDSSVQIESQEEWNKLREYHLVPGRMMKHDKGWCFFGSHRYKTPIPYNTNGGKVFCKSKGFR